MEKRKNKQFDKMLFSQQDIDYVKELVDKYIIDLYVQNISLKNNDKILKIEKEISKLHSSEIEKLLHNYEEALTESIEQQNCLAFYLGLKKGLELKKL